MVTSTYEKVATDHGYYWRSSASKGSLLQELRSYQQGPFFKTANIGGSTEEGFEQAFSSLAFAYLKDKAPRLLDFMIGFQLVDRNEDSTKAMGLFGFRVGSQWLYAPVFFLNGDLKGHELLYLKDQDAFVPMKENWVNYLMSRKPHVLGEPSDKQTHELGGLQPDVLRLSLAPHVGYGKRAVDDWAKPALPLIAAFVTGKAKAIYKEASDTAAMNVKAAAESPFVAALAGVAHKFDMNKVLPGNPGLLKNAFEISRRYPAIKRGFDRFYGPGCFGRWGLEARQQIIDLAANIMPEGVKAASADFINNKTELDLWIDKRAAEDARLIPPVDKPDHPVKSGAVEVYVYEETVISGKLNDLDQADREKLLNDTVLVKDKRDPNDVTKAYRVQTEEKLMNPHESGLYNVLEDQGEFSRMLVISNPYTNKGKKPFATLVRIGDSGNKAWLNAHRTRIFADKVEETKEYTDWYDGISDGPSNMKKNGIYVAIDNRGQGTCPFQVREVYGDGRYKVDFKARAKWDDERAGNLPRLAGTDCDCPSEPYVSEWGAIVTVDLEGKRGTKLRNIQGELRIPGNFKFFKLKDPPKPKKKRGDMEIMECSPCCDDEGSEDKPIVCGKIEDIQSLILEKTARLKIYDDHSEVSIGSPLGTQRLTKKAAFVSLIKDHGLAEAAAREMLKEAEYKQGATYRMTYAPGFGDKRHMTKSAQPNMSMLEGGPSMPAMPPPMMGTEPLGPHVGVNSIYPQEEYHPVDELQSGQTDLNQWDNWQNYRAEDFQGAMQTAQEAAGQGQKEVFDTSVISGLLKSVRQDSLVDRYLGDLMKALDKLGRILFLFYWHQEEFEDRYGKADLPELEDSLRNAFEALGDITLFLKEKTVEPISGEIGDVDLEETARN